MIFLAVLALIPIALVIWLITTISDGAKQLRRIADHLDRQAASPTPQR